MRLYVLPLSLGPSVQLKPSHTSHHAAIHPKAQQANAMELFVLHRNEIFIIAEHLPGTESGQAWVSSRGLVDTDLPGMERGALWPQWAPSSLWVCISKEGSWRHRGKTANERGDQCYSSSIESNATWVTSPLFSIESQKQLEGRWGIWRKKYYRGGVAMACTKVSLPNLCILM